MRLLVEFSHPAQVHKFKHLLARLQNRGWAVLVLSRDKDVLLDLLADAGLPHVCLSRARSGPVAMAFELLLREARTLYHVVRFRPTLILAAESVAVTHIGWLFRVPRVVHDENEPATLQQRLFVPFATRLVTTTAYTKDFGAKQRRIDSLEPLAYLHPNCFQADGSVLSKYGLSADRPHVVLRIIAWRAAHDVGLAGMDDAEVGRLIAAIRAAGVADIVATIEDRRDLVLDDRILTVDPVDFHQVLAGAALCVSEGVSVAIEAAVLGVPTILANPCRIGNALELARYDLLQQILDPAAVIDRVAEILADDGARTRAALARDRLLADKRPFTDAFEEVLLEVAGNG